MSSENRKTVLIVAGPTASGKSALGLRLAEALNGVIINADSMQIYSELPILTAQPDADEQSRAEHRLYSALSGLDSCSAGRWRDLAVCEIDQCHEAGQMPIILGGTGLYIKVLMEGLSRIPDVPQSFRDDASITYEKIGPEAVIDLVASCDPVSAATLKPNDRQRIIRAWEVIQATGKSLSQWQRENPPDAKEGYNFRTIAVLPEREEVYRRCNLRFEQMVQQGGIEEVESFLKLTPAPDLPLMRAIGVPEVCEYLVGGLGWDEMVKMAQQATRRYAKRQLTWIRNQINIEIKLQNLEEIDTIVANFNKKLSQ
jgi:tRNA dimethylallyltransferase